MSYDGYNDNMGYCDECDRGDISVINDKELSTPQSMTFVINTATITAAVVSEVNAHLISGLKAEINHNVLSEIKENIKDSIRGCLDNTIKQMIEELVETEKVTIGGGWDSEARELTYKEFIRDEIKKRVEKSEVSVKDNRGCNTSVSFKDYFVNHCVDDEVQMYVNKQVKEVKADISAKIRTLFESQTKSALSETVMQVLMASETYQGITNSIKRLSDGN